VLHKFSTISEATFSIFFSYVGTNYEVHFYITKHLVVKWLKRPLKSSIADKGSFVFKD